MREDEVGVILHGAGEYPYLEIGFDLLQKLEKEGTYQKLAFGGRSHSIMDEGLIQIEQEGVFAFGTVVNVGRGAGL
jgi:hypothetical protein